MQAGISSRLKLTFLIHAVVALIVGFGLLLIPAQVGTWLGVPLFAEYIVRLVGAAILSFAVSSILAFSCKHFEQIRLIIQVEIFWTLVATLVALYGASTLEAVPPVPVEQEAATRLFLYGSALLMALFFLAFGYSYLKEGRTEVSETQERRYTGA